MSELTTQNKHDMFSFSMHNVKENSSQSLDKALDDARMHSKEIFSISDLVQGRPNHKRQKTHDSKPIVFIRINTRLGKPKPVTLRALLDSGGSGTLVSKQFTKNLPSKTLPLYLQYNTAPEVTRTVHLQD